MGLRSPEVEEKHNKEADCDRAFVTGGVGSLGSHLVEGLLDRGFKVTFGTKPV